MGEFKIGVKSIIIYNRKVLMVQRSDGKNDWECPGGIMEFGEDLHTALLREIKEETGLEDICIEKLLYVMTAKVSPERQVVGLDYLSYANSDKITLSPDKHTDFIWADKKQLINLIDKSFLNDLKENNTINLLQID